MKKVLFVCSVLFFNDNAFATASGPDYLEVEIKGKKQVVKNLGCYKKVCKILYKDKEYTFPIAKTREASGPIAPTFDCQKATYKAETLICEKSELANHDRHMAIVYKDSIRKVEALDEGRETSLKRLKAMQRGWGKGRNDCWKDRNLYSCIEHNYKYRISYLQTKWDLLRPHEIYGLICKQNRAEIVMNIYKTSYYNSIKAEYGDKSFTLIESKTKNEYIGDGKSFSIDSKTGLISKSSFVQCKDWTRVQITK
ncbi:lysozyme inhibitor LprI family protein [Halobacteriovorax sp. RT-1-4]|uniref:lysozyme inhibitor LprI family protein n=1 Tax=unclassified Halobacteriovorax TaxID=2639665 RepID=UPI00399AC302